MEGANSHGCQPAPKQLTVLYYNTRSMLDELQASILFLKPDVICIVESWLYDHVTDNEISLPDYQMHRLDCNRHGGGIVLYAYNSLTCKVLLQGGQHNLEFFALSITSEPFVSISFIFAFFTVVHHPVSIFDNLCTALQMVNPAQFSIFLLLVDFNVNFCNPQYYLFPHVNDILDSF